MEQVIGELKGGPLAHLPSGRFSANAAWLGFAVIAFNISRAAATAAGHAAARMATLLRILTATPARIASTGRRQVMHLPARRPTPPTRRDSRTDVMRSPHRTRKRHEPSTNRCTRPLLADLGQMFR
ncbi:hypothetical protein GCM10011372_35010 [Agromyces bauzanensis]|uniref:Transposase DDE domain-containing protein n=1 Tax=Agromyces bauzanensis TaxID=1308924 RepID=A0A917UX31_9MICO|nr:hypothetical protein GCM10011372_35010 [Agromyces bauzanensis]